MSPPATRDRLASRRVIVGVDGSPNAIHALSWVLANAAREAKIVAITAWISPLVGGLPLMGTPMIPFDALEADAGAGLDAAIEAAAPGSEADRVERRVTMGSARHVLIDASGDADLVVVGRTGKGRLERLFIGSTATEVARHASCPVAIIPDGFPPISNITVAVDGSPNAAGALVWACGHPGATVTAVYSHDESVLDELGFGSDDRARFASEAERQLAVAVEQALADTGFNPADVHLEVRDGDPRTTIVDQGSADDLVVLGARGAGLASTLVGSLADHAIRHSPGAVVIHH